MWANSFSSVEPFRQAIAGLGFFVDFGVIWVFLRVKGGSLFRGCALHFSSGFIHCLKIVFVCDTDSSLPTLACVWHEWRDLITMGKSASVLTELD